jgi:hypothetical protein
MGGQVVARLLVEDTLNLIVGQLKTGLPTALASIRVNRADARVTTEPPKSYFIFESAKGYQTPAVFVIARDIDFLKEQRGANYISARVRVFVAALIEDVKEDLLTIKSFRYQAAIHEVLEQLRIEDVPNNVTILVIVKHAGFSGIEGRRNPTTNENVFRREVVLECDVEHWEKVG